MEPNHNQVFYHGGCGIQKRHVESFWMSQSSHDPQQYIVSIRCASGTVYEESLPSEEGAEQDLIKIQNIIDSIYPE